MSDLYYALFVHSGTIEELRGPWEVEPDAIEMVQEYAKLNNFDPEVDSAFWLTVRDGKLICEGPISNGELGIIDEENEDA